MVTAVTVCGERREYPKQTTYLELAKEWQGKYPHDIVLVNVNGKLQELHKKIKPDSEIEFVTTADPAGNSSYKRSVTQLMLKAVYDVAGQKNIEKVSVLFSLDKGYYCKITGKVKVDGEFLVLENVWWNCQNKIFPLKKEVSIQMMPYYYFGTTECMIKKNYFVIEGFLK